RWLDKRSGTFLSPDPVGYRDSANLYAYCAGDPVNCTDATGKARSDHSVGIVARLAIAALGDDNSAEPPAVLEAVGTGTPMIFVNGIENSTEDTRAAAANVAAWFGASVTA